MSVRIKNIIVCYELSALQNDTLSFFFALVAGGRFLLLGSVCFRRRRHFRSIVLDDVICRILSRCLFCLFPFGRQNDPLLQLVFDDGHLFGNMNATSGTSRFKLFSNKVVDTYQQFKEVAYSIRILIKDLTQIFYETAPLTSFLQAK